MAKAVEKMTIEELEAYRNELHLQIDELKAKMKEAGLILQSKVELMRMAGDDVDAAIEQAQAKVVKLQTLKAKAEAGKIGGTNG